MLDLADEAVLPKRYLEIALVTVSKLDECEYCVAHHEPRLVELGLGEETVERILEPDCPGLDAVERLVRDYAAEVTLRPQRVRDRMFEELRKHFSQEQVVELTLRTAAPRLLQPPERRAPDWHRGRCRGAGALSSR